MKKKKILVVDDEAVIRELLVDLLALRHIGCDGANGAAAALSLLERNRYFLIFLDYHLGKEKAPDVIGRLREKCRGTPIILMTGSAAVDEDELKKLAVADLVHKPFSCDRVLAAVNRHLELQ